MFHLKKTTESFGIPIRLEYEDKNNKCFIELLSYI